MSASLRAQLAAAIPGLPACHQWAKAGAEWERRFRCGVCGARCDRDRRGRIVDYAAGPKALRGVPRHTPQLEDSNGD